MTNFADLSNFRVGSDTLKLTPFYVKSFNIPSVSFSHIAMATRSGTKLKVGADTIEFGDLDLEVMIDSNFETYFEILDLMFKEVDWNYDSFAMPEFDLWLIVSDSKGNEKFRFDFKNCRINNIGNLNLDPEAELGSMFSLSITYDYFTWRYNKITEICENGELKKISEPKSVKRYYENAPFYGDFGEK